MGAIGKSLQSLIAGQPPGKAQDDGSSFDRQLQQCHPELVRYLHSRVANRVDADDIVQETLARLLHYRGDPQIQDVRLMLFRIANNVLTDHYRRNERHRAGDHVAQARTLGGRLRPYLDRFNANDYASIPAPERDAFTVAAADLVRIFEVNRLVWAEGSSRLAFERGYRNAVMVRQLNDMFRSTQDRGDPPTHSHHGPGMFENLRWVLEQEDPHGRVFLFAQVGHVTKKRRDNPRPVVGAYLHDALGDDYMAIGGLWGGGEVGTPPGEPSPRPPMQVGVYGALDRILPKVEGPLYFLDLRGMPPLPERPEFNGSAADYFDAVVFFRTISPVHPY